MGSGSVDLAKCEICLAEVAMALWLAWPVDTPSAYVVVLL